MCGIISIVGKDVESTAAERALDTLLHRGPDERAVMRFPNALLGQARLAIIDLSPGGHQPKKDNARDIAITFNGEIYNYKELRAELEKKGHHFSSQSDTEVILKAYIEYGERCPEYLDGMFAFTIWDDEKQRLFMARDRFGKKPLCYAYDPQGRFVAGSEIKALVAAGVRGTLDQAGIDLYLTLMYIPPWRSVYTNVHTLLPGHSATYTSGTLITKKYWELKDAPISISYDEAKEETRRLLTNAVKKRMLAADVEVGALLSGGVDSTLVTAYAQKFLDHPIKTFSLGYGEYINELPFAEAASKAVGTDHHTLQASGELTHELEQVLAYFDEPHGDSADFPQHLVSELAAKSVKVALVGDGGDELFLGYGHYWSFWHTRKIVRLKNMLFSNPFNAHLQNITVFPESMRRLFFKDPSVIGTERIDTLVNHIEGTGVKKINLFDITTYLPGQLLTKVDQASMMHSLEVRCPFLDHTLAEFAYNLPEEYKTDRATGKLILKDLLAEIMPREFVDRRKQGFGAPVRKWLTEPHMRRYVEEMLGPGARVYDFLREAPLQRWLEHVYRSGQPKNYYRLWVLLCLEIWLRQHKELNGTL